MAASLEISIADVNVISRYLAAQQITSLQQCRPVDVLVLCVSAILPIADTVFTSIEQRPDLAKTIVLCGGTGHSTLLLYQSIRRSKYAGIADRIDGLPEARVLELVIQEYYPRLNSLFQSNVLRLIVEDKSTNCGSNAIETKTELRARATQSQTFIIVQDPTMSLRTLESFRQAYADAEPSPDFFCCPTFVPMMRPVRDRDQDSILNAEFHVPGVAAPELWDVQRFFDLLMGEIPRLRDDVHGYGPKGKNFLPHIDIPAEVENAWERLSVILRPRR